MRPRLQPKGWRTVVSVNLTASEQITLRQRGGSAYVRASLEGAAPVHARPLRNRGQLHSTSISLTPDQAAQYKQLGGVAWLLSILR